MAQSKPSEMVERIENDLKAAMNNAARDAIAFQRRLSEQESIEARQQIESQGSDIVELSPDEHDAFVLAVKPQLDDARALFGGQIFELASL